MVLVFAHSIQAIYRHTIKYIFRTWYLIINCLSIVKQNIIILSMVKNMFWFMLCTLKWHSRYKNQYCITSQPLIWKMPKRCEHSHKMKTFFNGMFCKSVTICQKAHFCVTYPSPLFIEKKLHTSRLIIIMCRRQLIHHMMIITHRYSDHVEYE